MDDVKVMIEGAKRVQGKNGKVYYAFWVRLFWGDEFISISGWKYFVAEQKVGTPSAKKGESAFFNTVKMSVALYNKVRDEAERLLG